MKTRLKIIIPTSVAVIFMAVIVIFNIPHNLNKALRFDESEQMIISITEMKNISGQPVINSEHFTYKNGSVEFTDINNLLDEYSYNLTVSKAIREANRDVIIIDIYSNDSSVYLSNFDGSNTVINGKNYRISKNKVEELISRIIDICGIG